MRTSIPQSLYKIAALLKTADQYLQISDQFLIIPRHFIRDHRESLFGSRISSILKRLLPEEVEDKLEELGESGFYRFIKISSDLFDIDSKGVIYQKELKNQTNLSKSEKKLFLDDFQKLIQDYYKYVLRNNLEKISRERLNLNKVENNLFTYTRAKAQDNEIAAQQAKENYLKNLFLQYQQKRKEEDKFIERKDTPFKQKALNFYLTYKDYGFPKITKKDYNSVDFPLIFEDILEEEAPKVYSKIKQSLQGGQVSLNDSRKLQRLKDSIKGIEDNINEFKSLQDELKSYEEAMNNILRENPSYSKILNSLKSQIDREFTRYRRKKFQLRAPAKFDPHKLSLQAEKLANKIDLPVNEQYEKVHKAIAEHLNQFERIPVIKEILSKLKKELIEGTPSKPKIIKEIQAYPFIILPNGSNLDIILQNFKKNHPQEYAALKIIYSNFENEDALVNFLRESHNIIEVEYFPFSLTEDRKIGDRLKILLKPIKNNLNLLKVKTGKEGPQRTTYYLLQGFNNNLKSIADSYKVEESEYQKELKIFSKFLSILVVDIRPRGLEPQYIPLVPESRNFSFDEIQTMLAEVRQGKHPYADEMKKDWTHKDYQGEIKPGIVYFPARTVRSDPKITQFQKLLNNLIGKDFVKTDIARRPPEPSREKPKIILKTKTPPAGSGLS